MNSILIWINSAPTSPNLCSGFQLAQQMRAQGRTVSIFLAQDAVLASIRGNQNAPVISALQAGMTMYALNEDLALRGFALDTLRDGVRVADFAQVVELFEQHDQVIGAL